MSKSHWSNVKEADDDDESREWNQIVVDQNQMFQATIYAERYTSIFLELDSNLNLTEILKVLPNMVNVRSATVKCHESANILKVKQIFQILAHNDKITELELHIQSAYDPLKFLGLYPLQLTSLSLDVQLILLSDDIFNSLVDVINNNFSKLTSLLEMNVHFNMIGLKKRNGIEIVKFFDSIQTRKLFLSKFKITISGLEQLNEVVLENLSEWVGSISSLTYLSIDFQTIEIRDKAFEEFLSSLARAQFTLEGFTLRVHMALKERSYKILRKFLKQQEQLEFLEINDIEIPSKLMDSFLYAQDVLKKIKTIHYDLERNNIRNGGLKDISDLFIQKRSSLQKIKIFLDRSVFSGESLVLLGKALRSILFLKDLRIQFPGKVVSHDLFGLADDLSGCSLLQYLYLYFSGSGSSNICEWEADSPDKTIFECETVDVGKRILSWRERKLPGNINYFIVNLAIASKSMNCKHITFEYPHQYQSPYKLNQYQTTKINEILSNQSQLESISSTGMMNSPDNINKIVQLIKKNELTLKRFKMATILDVRIFNALAPIGKNLLSLGCFSIQLGLYENGKIQTTFPNLIEMLIHQDQFQKSYLLSESSSLIQSDIALFCLQNLKSFRIAEQAISVQAVKEKRTALMLQIAFDRSVRQYLLYKPQYMIADLQMEL